MRIALTTLVFVATVFVGTGCGPGGSGANPAPVADPAAEVLQVDARLNQITFPKGRDEAKLRALLAEVNSIDISRCPADYQSAFTQLASATGAMVDYMIETGSWEHSFSTGVESFLRGFTMIDPFATVRESRERRRQLQSRITEAIGNYQRTLAKYKK
jgi:hypothetical protein